MRRRVAPPEVVEPECEVCGSFEVVQDGPFALCEKHNHPIRQKRMDLERKIQKYQEDQVQVEMRMEHGMSNERLEQLAEERNRHGRKLADAELGLRELREECDHEEEEMFPTGQGETYHRCELCKDYWRESK